MTTNPKLVYVIYSHATPEAVWNGLIDPTLTRRYWQHVNVSDWKPGSRWEHKRSDGSGVLDIAGKGWPALMSAMKTLLESASLVGGVAVAEIRATVAVTQRWRFCRTVPNSNSRVELMSLSGSQSH